MGISSDTIRIIIFIMSIGQIALIVAVFKIFSINSNLKKSLENQEDIEYELVERQERIIEELEKINDTLNNK